MWLYITYIYILYYNINQYIYIYYTFIIYIYYTFIIYIILYIYYIYYILYIIYYILYIIYYILYIIYVYIHVPIENWRYFTARPDCRKSIVWKPRVHLVVCVLLFPALVLGSYGCPFPGKKKKHHTLGDTQCSGPPRNTILLVTQCYLYI